MKEFIVYNREGKINSEENSIVKACKSAYNIGGYVAIKNIKNGEIKEVIKGKSLEFFAKYRMI